MSSITTTTPTPCLLLLCCLLFTTCSALIVKDLPHLQTFDSWDICVYDGGCYEQDCSSYIKGGWSTPAFQNIPFDQQTWGWWINSGLTPSNRNITTREMLNCSQAVTGPCSDHTSSTGNYLYAEASGCGHSPLSASSPYIVFTNTSATLSFWYYYYGYNLWAATSFDVVMTATDTNGAASNFTVFNMTGLSTGAEWLQAKIDLSSFFSVAPNATNPITTTFTFKVTPSDDRNNFLADIAIDDVMFTQDGASASPVPYVDPSPSPSASPAHGRPAVSTSGGGLSDAEIGGIVGGVVIGFLLLALLLGLLLVGILLIISPKKPAGPAPAPNTVL